MSIFVSIFEFSIFVFQSDEFHSDVVANSLSLQLKYWNGLPFNFMTLAGYLPGQKVLTARLIAISLCFNHRLVVRLPPLFCTFWFCLLLRRSSNSTSLFMWAGTLKRSNECGEWIAVELFRSELKLIPMNCALAIHRFNVINVTAQRQIPPSHPLYASLIHYLWDYTVCFCAFFTLIFFVHCSSRLEHSFTFGWRRFTVFFPFFKMIFHRNMRQFCTRCLFLTMDKTV